MDLETGTRPEVRMGFQLIEVRDSIYSKISIGSLRPNSSSAQWVVAVDKIRRSYALYVVLHSLHPPFL